MIYEPLFSFFENIDTFSSPDQLYWRSYAELMVDSPDSSYEQNREKIINELNLTSVLDFEDAYIRKYDNRLYLSPIYTNIYLKDITGSPGKSRFFLEELLGYIRSSSNILSIYHRNCYSHQIDIKLDEPFTILIMGSEKDIESNIKGLDGKPDIDNKHLLIESNTVRRRLKKAIGIISRRLRKSRSIIENSMMVLRLLDCFADDSLIRIPVNTISDATEIYCGKPVSFKDIEKALYMLTNGHIIDFMDYFK